MPWRLIFFILICAVFVVFITFNIENKCDISLIFTTIPAVPVFITIFVSFVLGLFFALPLVIHVKKRRTDIRDKDEELEEIPTDIEANEKIRQDAAEAKKRFFSKRRGG